MISVENGLWAGNLMKKESAELGQQHTRGKKAVQLGKKLFAKSAGLRKKSRHAVYNTRLEVQEETVMERVWVSEMKHQMNRWKDVNGALHVHLTIKRRRYEKKLGKINRS